MSFSGVHNLDVLRWEQMTDTVRKFPIPGEMWFSKNLFTNRVPLIGTDTAKWDEISRARKRAPFAVRGQPAQRMDLLDRSTRTSSIADIFVSKHLKAENIEYLRTLGSAGDSGGAQMIIAEELSDLVERVQWSVEWACVQAARGSLTVDQSSSTDFVKSQGVNFTVTFPVTTLNAGADWATAGTDIYNTEISAIEAKMVEVWGGVPGRIVHTRKVMDYLLKNTSIKDMMSEQYKQQLLGSRRLTQIRGINFYQYDTGDDNSGSFASYFPDDYVLVLPNDNRYFEIHEADALIPGPNETLIRSSPGLYSYAKVTHNPVGIELFVGYRFLPVSRWAERSILVDIDV